MQIAIIKSNNNITMKNISIELKYGFIMFAMIGGYFLVIDALGFTDNLFFRLLNLLIVGFAINAAIYEKIQKSSDEYIAHFKAGLITALIGTGISVFALSGYIAFFKDTTYLANLSNSLLIGLAKPRILAISAAVFAEGLASSIVITFISMQFWKNHVPANEKA